MKKILIIMLCFTGAALAQSTPDRTGLYINMLNSYIWQQPTPTLGSADISIDVISHNYAKQLSDTANDPLSNSALAKLPTITKQKRRLRFDHTLWREDITYFNDDIETNTITTVKAGNSWEPGYYTFTYNSQQKTAEISSKSPGRGRHYTACTKYSELFGVMRVVLGDRDKSENIPSRDKLARIVAGSDSDYAVKVEEVNPGLYPRLKFTVTRPSSGDLVTIFTLDRYNFDRVYSYEFYAYAGKPYEKWTASKFDKSGFPHSMTWQKYDNGELTETLKINVNDLTLNPELNKTIFEFNPPKEYKTQDNRTSNN